MIGYTELIIIFVIILILFGADKLPDLARSLGKSTKEFKKAQIEAENEITKLTSIEKLDDKGSNIYKLASDMGIDTKNKTKEQLIDEMRGKIRYKKLD